MTPESAALLAFVRAIGLRKGDVQRIVLNGPHGEIVEHAAPPLDQNKDQALYEVGRKKPALGWEPGEYKATYTVTRDGKAVIEKTFTVRPGLVTRPECSAVARLQSRARLGEAAECSEDIVVESSRDFFHSECPAFSSFGPCNSRVSPYSF